ncbi:MBL fold metallo-hydrolase [Streptomyces sp. MUM 203J]|uniref:MBL fold metallo-hydrolase n=1 Tax=Streptomyces sp. MUM 203J TaxID=2791990 RepID=UPI001F03DC2D|nr:MBL fold metallo-hydrolase [Streptomyces sp. MUM 203J]MCH0540294.1 MBL fold metallo-hydrolase [Streptomyces sp. MUM 203J]
MVTRWSTADAPHLREVADGVHAYLQPDGGWCLNNAGFVVSDGSSLLVDTAATQARALALKKAVAAVSPTPPRFVVNTHSHGDHTFGNHVFTDHAVVVAHEETRAEMDAVGLHLTTLWPEVSWGEVSVALPTVTFRGRLTLHIGTTPVELVPMGPAHTAVDTAVWLPRQRVLFAGDLLLSGATPFCLMGSISGSLKAVAEMRALRPEVIVAGHGPVAGPELLDTAERYFHWLRDTADKGLAAGLTPLETAREADLGEWDGLLDSERLVPNLHRAYAEARGAAPGAPLDINGMFSDMVQYHGSLPVCHA